MAGLRAGRPRDCGSNPGRSFSIPGVASSQLFSWCRGRFQRE